MAWMKACLILVSVLFLWHTGGETDVGWYSSGQDKWTQRYSFSADHTKVGADVSDLPTPIKITTSEWPALANARADGADIFFTEADGTTRVPHVQISWDGTTYIGYLKCTHDVDADKEFYAYCGGPPLTLVHLVKSSMGPGATTTQRVGPQTYYHSGTHKRTYFVWQDTDNTPWIAFYDHDDNRWSRSVHVATTPTGDAHYHPAVFVNANGYVFVFYGCHSSTLYYKKSTAAEDISAWGSAVSAATYATYPYIVTLNGTTVYVFFRSGSATEKRGYVSYIKSTDGGANWGSQVDVIDWTGEATETIPYMDTGAAIGADGSLHFTVKETVNSDPQSDEDLWYFFSEDGGATWKNRAETASKNVTTSGAITMAERSDYLAYNSTYSLYGSHICLDENSDPLILFLERASGVDAGNWVYKALRYSSGWQAPVTVVDSGSERIYGAALRHIGSGVFDVHLTVLSGSVMEIHKYQSGDRGVTWSKLEELSSGSSYHASGLKLSYNAPSGEQFLLYHRDNSPEDVYAQRSIVGIGHTPLPDTSVFASGFRMWQSMEDGFSTSEVLDLTANQHHGTKKGAAEPASGTGKVGSGQVFDGSDDYIDFGDSDDFSFGNGSADSAFSIQALVKLDDISVLRPIVYKYNVDDALLEWELFVSSGKVYFVCADEVATARIGRYYNTALSIGVWYHIVVTYDGSGASSGITIYIDAVARDDADYNNGTYVAMHNTAQPVEAGRFMTSTDRFMDGLIDELVIYAGEWPSTTVTTMCNSQSKPLIGESGGFWKAGTASRLRRRSPIVV